MTLLEEDTRHSLMIEGYFVDRRQLQEILSQNPQYENRAYAKVTGYFDAALFSYELAYQQYKTKEFQLTKALILQMHAMMMRNDPQFQYEPGAWRKGDIVIAGSKVKTVPYHHVQKEIEKLIAAINKTKADPIQKAALAHAAFERIHPFPDGNGRVGRILLNFILIAHGFPNVSLKGFEEAKKEYIAGLEEADEKTAKIIGGDQSYDAVLGFKPLVRLEDLICVNLAQALDHMICSQYVEKYKQELMTLDVVGEKMAKSIRSLRVACSQKKFISTKIKSMLYTHPDLLQEPK